MQMQINNKGFSLLEIIIAIAILGVLATVIVSSFFSMRNNADLNSVAREIINVIKIAQNKTIASENDKQYGVYFDIAANPDRYILFRGTNYASRDSGLDQFYQLPDSVEFSGINLGGGNEVVFAKLTGAASQSGSVSVRLKTDASQTKTIYISAVGIVSFDSQGTPLDTRVKDSRHIRFNYGRFIDTATEKVILTFNDSVVKEITISQNMVGNQIYWEGTVPVGGDNQTVKIHTVRLNNPDTQFSVHRDRRYNNKSLKITISGDASGNIAQYSADGLTTSYSSAYVSSFEWQ